MLKENQERFRKAEGFELMVRCLKERKFAAISAVKVLNFAISGNLVNCERLIEAGGLKYLFPHLMGRNLPKVEKKKDKKSDKRDLTEAAISIISQLCHMVCNYYFEINHIRHSQCFDTLNIMLCMQVDQSKNPIFATR